MPRERFRLACVRLVNFTSHADTKIALAPGTMALVGENGAGKTSILEAIYYALTLEPWRGSKGASVVRRGAKKAVIQVTLVGDAGTKAVLQVEIEKTGSRSTNKPKLILQRPGEKPRVAASQVTYYKREVARLLGFQSPADLKRVIDSAVMVRQGGLRAIAEALANPGELRERLEKALGVPEYKEAVRELQRIDLAADMDPETGSWSPPATYDFARAQKYRRLNASINEAYTRLREGERLAEDKRRLAGKLRRQASSVQEEIRGLEAEAEMLSEQASRAKNIEERLNGVRSEIERLRGEAESLQSEIERLEEEARGLPEAERLAALAGVADEAAGLRAEIAEAQARLEAARRALALYEELARLEGVEGELEEAKRLLARLRARKQGLEAEKNRLLAEKARLEEARRGLEREASRAAKLLPGAPRDPEALLDAIHRAAAEAEAKAAEAEERATALEAEAGKHESLAAEAEAALEALQRASQPRCPVCGSPLDAESRRRLREALEARIEKHGREAVRLRGEAEKARGEAVRLRERARRLALAETSLSKALEDFDAVRLRAVEEKLARIEEEIRRVEAELEAASARLGELRSKLRLLEDTRRKLGEALRSLPADARDPEALKAYAEGLEARLEEARRRLQEAERALLEATGAGGLDEAISRVRRAVERLPRLRESKARLDEKRAALRRIEETLEKLEAEESRLAGELEALSGVEERLREARARLEAARGRLQELQEQAAAAEAEAKRLEEEAARLRERLAALQRVRRRMEAAAAAMLVFEKVQDALMRRAVATLNDAMNDVLSRFNLDYASVDLRLDKGGVAAVAVSRSVGEVEIPLLSGGEQSAIALAYVLGLQRILSMGADFIALDEPTSELDEERRGALLDILDSAAGDGASQLLVVTHHEEVVDKVDRVCKVVKERGVSRLVDPQTGSECPSC